MKKLIVLLGLLVMPLGVNAEVDLEKIHNDISENNELIVNSVPISYYKETTNYKICMNDNFFDTEEEQSNFCLNDIYSLIVNSHLRKTFDNSEEINYYVNNCDLNTNTCKIMVVYEDNELSEEYTIKFGGTYNENVSKKAIEFSDSLKQDYYLADMSYINQLINYTNRQGVFDAIVYDSYKILNIFPEFKSNLEKNPGYEYVPVNLGMGGSPILYGASSVVVIYYNDVAVGISEMLSYYTMQLMFIPDTTENTEEAYIAAAKKRIEEYLNNEDYEISLTYDSLYEEEYCSDEWDVCDVSRELNYMFEDSETYVASPYTLKINDQEYFVGIVPVSEENITDLEVKSLNYETDISIETKGSNVPLDTVLEAKDVSADYQKHGFDKAYDLNLYSLLKDGYITRVYDGVKVRIPVSDGYDKNNIDIYHIKENGEKEEKYTAEIKEINGKKYAEFTTNHFSIYGIASEENPQTSDNIQSSILLLLVSLIGLCVTANYYKKRLN